MKAVCREHKDKPFVLEWSKAEKPPSDSIDQVIMSNPQALEWDSNVDGYVRIDAAGKRFNYDGKDYSKADGSPFDPNGENWTSGFEAEIQFSADAPCPSCAADYGWGDGYGAPIKKVFDGKHLRSLTSEERKSLTNTKLLK